MTNRNQKNIRVAIAGLGAIGKAIAVKLSTGTVPGIELTAVSAKNHEKAQEFIRTLAHPVQVLHLEDLEPHADIVVECAPAEFLGDIISPFLKKQKKAIVLSVGAILFRPDLVELAKQTGGVIMVPTGALIGLDAVVAAAEGQIYSARMVTRKPPNGLVGAPYLIEHGISLEGLKEPLKVFTGNAKDAATFYCSIFDNSKITVNTPMVVNFNLCV
jgi:aspartate dehydrogenase